MSRPLIDNGQVNANNILFLQTTFFWKTVLIIQRKNMGACTGNR